jgi:hypothetical protein
VKKVSVEKRFAIAVRDGGRLLLFMWVKWVEGSTSGEFFAFLPRPHDTSINAHASYHADGGYYIKSHDMSNRNRIMRQLKQRPDQNFAVQHIFWTRGLVKKGPVQSDKCVIPTLSLSSSRSPSIELGNGELNTHVSADLISHGHGPNLVPDARVIRQKEYRDVFPFIVFTLYEMPTLGG